MIFGDFHVHSSYCDGKDGIEDLVVAAIDKGLEKLGIVAHSYLDFEPVGSLLPSKKADLIKEMNALKGKYSDKIQLYCGIERDFYSYTPTNEFDYVIGSVHFISNGDKRFPVDWTEKLLIDGVNEAFDGDFYTACEKYYDTVVEMTTKFKPDFIGHLDLITKFNEGNKLFNENNPRYVRAYKNAVDCIMALKIPFEINVGAISRGYRTHPYPSKEIIEYIKERGGKLILSSDAHDKNNIAYQFDVWKKYL